MLLIHRLGMIFHFPHSVRKKTMTSGLRAPVCMWLLDFVSGF